MTAGTTASGSSRSDRHRQGRPPERSLWAIASLICSLAVCPPLCVIGPVLGVGALVDLRYRPHRTGRKLAYAGIALGLIFTIGWGGGLWWWHANVRRPLLNGPSEALVLGFDGDIAAFKTRFTGPGAEAEDAEVRAFLDELTRRYGVFGGIRLGEVDGEDEAGEAVDPARVVVPYVFAFERESVPGAAEFVTIEGRRLPMILRWRWIRLDDPVRGDLAYPEAALPPGEEDEDEHETAPDRPPRP